MWNYVIPPIFVCGNRIGTMAASSHSNQFQDAIKQFQTRETEAEEQLLFGHNVLPELHTGQDFYGLYIITLLLANNLNEAKYLWKRAPQEVKSPNGISQMGSAWEIGKAIWNHNTKQALHVMSTTQWHASLKPSVDKLYQEVISKECFLLHQSLQSILTTPLVESRLGISATDINTVLQAAGWTVSAEGLTLIPPPATTPIAHSNALAINTDLQELHRLVQIVAYSEQKPHKVDNKGPSAEASEK